MMSPLGLLNFCILQWFGVRLARVYERRWVIFGREHIIPRHWVVLRWIWPLTGWWSDFRYIKR